jgi:Ca2+-transporting ATPase
VLARPPRDPRGRFVDRSLLGGIAAGGASLFAAVTGVYLWATWSGAGTVTAQTLAFVTWMVGYLALAWVMRSARTPLSRLGWGSNRFLPVWTVVTAVALVGIMTVPALRAVVKVTSLSPGRWAVAVVVALVAVSWLEVAKRFHSRGTPQTNRN